MSTTLKADTTTTHVYVVVDQYTDTGVYYTTNHAQALRKCTYGDVVHTYSLSTHAWHRMQDRVRATS